MPHSSCAESWCVTDQTPLSQETLSDWVNWSVTQPPSKPEPSYPNSTGEQGEEIEPPTPKTGPQIPINRSLESLQSIKFHLPRWSGQSGSFFCTQCASLHKHARKPVRMHEGKNKRATDALKLTHVIVHTSINTSTIKQIRMKTHMHTLRSTPPLSTHLSINNLRHCGACDPVTFDLWSLPQSGQH